MKKTLLSLVVLVQIAIFFAKPISIDQSETVGLNWCKQWNFPNSAISSIDILTNKDKTNCIYLLHLKPSGFIFISGDDKVKPIMGYNFKLNINKSKLNYQINDMIDRWLKKIDEINSNSIEATLYNQSWRHLLTDTSSFVPRDNTRDILIPFNVHWNSGEPYDNQTPVQSGEHVYPGCATVALSQMLKYWNYPLVGQGTHTNSCELGNYTVNFGQTHYDWYEMPPSLSSGSPQSEINEISKLIYNCGVAINANWGNESEANFSDVLNALEDHFRYNNSAQHITKLVITPWSSWYNSLTTELNAGRPLIYGGVSGNTGHAYIIHGFQTYSDEPAFYINLGWGNEDNCDGYYFLDDGTPVIPNPDFDNLTYYNSPEAIIGIQPLNAQQTMYVESQNPDNGIIINGTGTDLMNNSAGGTTSYERYYNNGATITLTAPQITANKRFIKWTKNDIDYSTSLNISAPLPNNVHLGSAYYKSVYGTPTISVNPTSLNFGNVIVNTNSPLYSYQLSGENLVGGITIQSASGYLISTSQSGTYMNTLNINDTNGTVTQTIWVRFQPTNVQSYNYNCTHSSTGASNVNVALYGNGVQTILSTPTNLIASPLSSSQIYLSWTDNSINENGFNIERKTGVNGTWCQINSVQANIINYNDTGLSSNTTYYYRVIAFNTQGFSNYSSVAFATTVATVVNAVNPTSITFPVAGGSHIVQITTSGTWQFTEAIDWINCTNSSSSSFTLTATANTGSARSATILVHFNSGSPTGSYLSINQPEAPLDHVHISGYVFNSAGIAMSDVNIAFSNDTFGNNDTETDIVGSYSEPVQIGWTGRATLQIPGYTIDPPYRDYSNVTSNRNNENYTLTLITPQPIPNSPSNIGASLFASTQINIIWTDNSTNEDGFKIERKTGSAGTWSPIATVGIGTTSFMDTGLTTNTVYYYRVKAFNGAGDSGYTNEIFASTGSQPGALPAPINLVSSVIASTQVRISWTDNSNNENGFKIERKMGTAGTWSQITTVSTGINSYLSTDLTTNTTYYYRVKAFNVAGDSDYSNEISVNASNFSPPAQTQDWLWATSAGGVGESVDTESYSMATDSNGNSYITGYFEGTANFGSTTLISSGYEDIFIAKISANGNWLWAKQAGGVSDHDEGRSISIDNSGNCYVTGNFETNATFGNTTLISTFRSDIFVAKLDTNGNWLWARRAGGTSNGDDGRSITTDSNGNSYVTGYFNSTATFGATSLTSFGERDIFIAKIDTNGNWLWAKGAGGTGYDFGQGISIDISGNCYLTGIYSGSASFGTTLLTSNGNYDIIIAKLNTTGTWLWAKGVGGLESDYGCGISTDSNGNSYVTGYFMGTANFGSTPLTSNGDSDIYIAKLDTYGNWLWVKRAGGTGLEQSNCIDIDNGGNIYIAGLFNNTADFGPASLTSIGSNSASDIFVAKLDIGGNWISATRSGGTYTDLATGISSDSNGNGYVTGRFNSAANFNSHSITSLYNNDDIFVAKISTLSTVASFTASATAGSSPLSVHFTDTSRAGNGILTSWLWNFGDGSTSPEQNPTHIYYSRGVYSVTLTIWNSLNITSTLTIPNMINVTNQVPHVFQEMPDMNLNEDFSTFMINLDNYFVDNDDGLLIYTVEHNPNIISAFVSGNTLIMSSVLNQSGTANITITANDIQSRSSSTRNSISRDRATCADTFNVNILPVNDPPVISMPASFTFDEDGTLTVNMTQYVSDVDNTNLTITSQNSAHISVSMNGMNAAFTSSLNWFGMEQVTFTVNDNVSRKSTISKGNIDLSNKSGRLHGYEGVKIFSSVKENLNRESRATSSASVNIVVTPVNDAPVIILPASFTFAEDNTLSINMVLYASDVDNTLTLTASGNTNVTVAITGMNVTLGALLNWSGTEQVTFTVNDNMGRAIASDIADIIVTPVNDAPVINLPESFSFLEDSNLVVNMATYVSDVDNTNLTVTAQNTDHITVVMNGMNATITASLNWNGNESVSFTVSDGLLNSTDQVNVIVTPVNDAPVIDLPASFTFDEDTNLTVNFALYCSAVDNTNLSLSVTGNTNITASITGLSIVFNSPLNWSGLENLIFIVSDGVTRATAIDSALVIVTPINDPPIIISFLPTQTSLSAALNETLSFSINATDIDSPISYSWFVDNVNQNNSTVEFTYQFTQSGTLQVKAVVSDNVSTVEQIWIVSVPVANDDPQVAPLVTRLYANYPNPFNPKTTIRYSIKEPVNVLICVYNIKGNIVKNLIQSKVSAGSYSIDWDGTNNAGKQVSSGVYYLFMKANNYQSCKKMVMLK